MTDDLKVFRDIAARSDGAASSDLAGEDSGSSSSDSWKASIIMNTPKRSAELIKEIKRMSGSARTGQITDEENGWYTFGER